MAKKGTRYKAKCVTACFWLKQYWPIGKIYEGIRKPPIHFSIIEGMDKESESEEEIVEEVETNDESGGSE